MNKKIKLVGLLIVMLLISIQIYWKHTYGNIIIYVQNQDIESDYTTEILIDDKIVQEYKFSKYDIIPHKLTFDKKFGTYKISVLRTDNKLREDFLISNFLVTWVVISVHDPNNIFIEQSITPPFLP